MAGPWVKSAVPEGDAAVRRPRPPVLRQCPYPQARRRSGPPLPCDRRWCGGRSRFSSTARVTLASVWLTPCATTPLSAHSTSTARLARSGVAVARQRGGSLHHRFQPAQSAQRFCQRGPVGVGGGAGGLVRRGHGFKQVFSSFSVMVFLYIMFGGRHKALRQRRPAQYRCGNPA